MNTQQLVERLQRIASGGPPPPTPSPTSPPANSSALAAATGAAEPASTATTVAELIADRAIDVILNLTPAPVHAAVISDALAAGKHVYSEWPLGANSAQASELAALADAAGVRHVVGLQGRKSPLVNYVRDLVADGYVGTVLAATLTVAGGEI